MLRGDLVAVLLVLLLAAWTVVSTLRGQGDPRPEGELLLLAAGTYGAGRFVSGIPRAVPVTAAGIAVYVAGAVLSAPGSLSGTALAAPLDYGNADGALCTLGVGAALVAGLSFRSRWVRLGALLPAGFLAALAALTRSQAGTAVAALLLGIGLLLALRPWLGRALPVVGALVVLLALSSTVALAVVHQSGGSTGVAGGALTDRRVVLWDESVRILEDDLLLGAGAGEFQHKSPTARRDRDARWSHSLWLQQAAETGAPGVVLLLALCGTLLVRIRADGWRDGGVPAMGSAVLAGFLLHSSIDYTAHFPLLTAGVALLAGLTCSVPPLRSQAPRRVKA